MLLTHDAPSGLSRGKIGVSVEMQAEMDHCRRLISAAVDNTQPKLLFHGHYHERRSDILWRGDLEVAVESVAADINGNGDAWGVLTLDTLTFQDGNGIVT